MQYSDQYGMNYQPMTSGYQYGMLNSSAGSQHSGAAVANYAQLAGVPVGGYAEYPLMAAARLPPAARACLHVANNQSYRSVPMDDIQYHSRQPAMTSSMTSSMSSQETSLSFGSSAAASSAPQPLNENISLSSSQYMTDLAENRPRAEPLQGVPQGTPLRPQQKAQRLDAEIKEGDPRYKTYYHLKNLFPEVVVRRVMNGDPKETDPNKITGAVLAATHAASHSARASPRVQIDC